MAYGEPISGMIEGRAFSGNSNDRESTNKTVLSCGGIYIPHRGDRHRTLHQILTTPRKDEPVKIISSIRVRNVLQQLMMKESLN